MLLSWDATFYWSLYQGANMYMFCFGRFWWVTVNILFSMIDVLVSCLTINSWTCSWEAEALCISAHIHVVYHHSRVDLKDEATKATCESHLLFLTKSVTISCTFSCDVCTWYTLPILGVIMCILGFIYLYPRITFCSLTQ